MDELKHVNSFSAYNWIKEAHIWHYNGSTSSEVAEIIPGVEDGQVGRRDIVLRQRVTLN